jgi:predicted  nucleic acid-binding Zn-ribbon protein
MNTKIDTRPAADRLKELRVNLHELYKRKQSETMSEAELDRVNDRIDALGQEISAVQREYEDQRR